MILRVFATLWILLLGFVVPALAQPPVTLIYKWEPGQTAYTRLTVENSTAIDRGSAQASSPEKAKPGRRDAKKPGAPVAPPRAHDDDEGFLPLETGTRSRKHVYTFRVDVAGVDGEGEATVNMTVLDAAVDADDPSGGGRFVFDTKKPDASRQKDSADAKKLRGLVGKVITLRVSSDGTMRNVEGLDQLAGSLAIPVGDNPLAEKLAGALTQSAGRDDMQSAVGLGLRFLPPPGKPVKQGDTWSTTMDQALAGLGAARSRWDSRLERLGIRAGKKIATIKSKAAIVIDGSAAPAGATALLPGIKLSFQDGTGTAQTDFDVEKGQAVRATMDLTLPIELRFSIGGSESVFQQTVTTKMTNEVIEKP